MSKKTTIRLLLIMILLLSMINLLQRETVYIVQAPTYEDFTTYTEVEPFNRVDVINATHINYTAWRNEESYCYYDYVASYFEDFEFYLDVMPVEMADSSDLANVWLLANYTDDWNGLRLSGYKTLDVNLFNSGGAPADQDLRIGYYDGSSYSPDVYEGVTTDTWYYLHGQRYGADFNVSIYSSDANRQAETGALDVLQVTCDTSSYRYSYACNVYNDGASKKLDVSIRRLAYLGAASEYYCRVVSSPEISANFTIDAVANTTIWSGNVANGSRTFNATERAAARNSGLNIYGFSHWMVTNSSGDFNFSQGSITIDLQTNTNFTIFYENSFTINVTSTPYTAATFNATGYSFTAPQTLIRNNATHTFTNTLFEILINSSYKYTFDYWSVNGSGAYYGSSIYVDIGGDTNLTMHYLGSSLESPITPTFTHDALNATWYLRSDTHTINTVLGYKLDTSNTQTEASDSRTTTGTHNISYGIRVWAWDIFNNTYELSGGSPEAIVTRTADAQGIQSAYFTCPAVNTLIDAIQINVYQRFDSDSWSLRRYFITDDELFYKFPEASWTISYYTNRTVSSTTAYLFHGSTTYSSSISLQYYRANPWEIALARLQDQNYLAFFFTPWSFYLGDMFWSVALLFCVVTAYTRWGSIKPVLAILWIFGGAGSVLSALIPALALQVAWLMLAVAMGITFFKLVYK